MQRRRFIVGSVGSLGALALATTLPGCRMDRAAAVVEPIDGLLDSHALTVLRELRGTTPVARSWLQRHAQLTPDRETLERRLLDHVTTDEPAQLATQHFSERLAASVSRDFRNGHLCEIDGWLLSETECVAAATRLTVFGGNEPAEETAWREGHLLDVANWGPQGTMQGVGVNVQPDGHSGLWFQIDHATPWLRIEIDGVALPTNIAEHVVTSGLYGEQRDHILATPGEYAIALIDPMQRIRQPIGVFTVSAPPPYLTLTDGSTSVFCAVDAWGPDGNHAGRPANPQPDDHDGLWFRTACAPDEVQVLYDGDPLPTTNDRGNGLVTALIPASHYAVAREARIQLHDPVSGEVLDVGVFAVRE